jgi:hypothetical protein
MVFIKAFTPKLTKLNSESHEANLAILELQLAGQKHHRPVAKGM